jgi:hypothetical protein
MAEHEALDDRIANLPPLFARSYTVAVHHKSRNRVATRSS